MRYVIAGYVIVLGLLFLYGAQLAWRRRRLTRAVARVVSATTTPAVPATAAATTTPAVPAEQTGDTR
jgi:hypothetical protein